MFERCVYLLRKRTPGNRNIKQRVAINLSRQTAFNILVCWIIECHFVATDGSSVCDFKVEISWNNDVCTFIFMPSIWNRKKNTMTFGAFVFASVLTIVAHEKMTQIETLETKQHWQTTMIIMIGMNVFAVFVLFAVLFFYSFQFKLHQMELEAMQVCSFVTRYCKKQIMESFVFRFFIWWKWVKWMNNICCGCFSSLSRLFFAFPIHFDSTMFHIKYAQCY